MVGTVSALTRAAESRDPFCRGHAQRVAALADIVARRLGFERAELAVLRLGARLHDVGKLAVTQRVLLKPGALDRDELVEIRAHPAYGVRLIDWLEGLAGIVPLVLHHHERWDGGGYPAGLAGEEIPLGARILAAADSFDAMTTDRAYRNALPAADAIAELIRCSGTQFDPRVIEVFVDAWECGEVDLTPPAAAVV